jgi:transposase InsO family protein
VAASGDNKAALARRLGISRSSLYYKPKLPDKDESLRKEIEQIQSANPGYGYRRVALALGINAKRAQRVMKKFNLRPLRRAKAPRKRADENKAATNRPDVLSLWCPIEPDVVWVSDFTYIRFHGRFLYLATVLDAYTGEVLGFNTSWAHTAEFVLTAIERAYRKLGKLPKWFHSDQGSEFDSELVTDWLQRRGVKLSNSPKGSPWRNGSQESFFGRFKVEFGDFERFTEFSELLEELYYMLHYFSELRIKNKLKMSPAEFRKQWNRDVRTQRKKTNRDPTCPAASSYQQAPHY